MMAFLVMAGNAVWGQELNLSNPTSSSGIDVSGNKITISGDGSFKIIGDGQPKDYYIVTNDNPTITLENVYLKHEGGSVLEINISSGGDVKLILLGENTFEAPDEMCIKNTTLGHLIVQESSTGSLTIKGKTGIDGDAGYPGDVTINGGTVIFDTTDSAISGLRTLTPSGSFEMQGNGVVVTNKPFQYIKWNKNNFKGIFFDNSSAGNNGKGYMYSDVTLSSPLDLTDNNLTATLNTNGHTLTLASGYTLKCDAEEDITGSGTVKAYRVDYDYGQLEGCSAQEAQLPTDYNRYGPSTEVILSDKELSCSTDQDAFVGWMKSGDNKVSTQITTDSNVPNATTITEVAGAWIRKALTLTAEAGEEGVTASFTMSEGLAATAEKTTTKELPTGIDYASLAFITDNTTQAGTSEYVYNVTPTGGTEPVEVKVTFNIQGKAEEITKEDVTVKTDIGEGFTYDGTSHTVVNVTVKGNGSQPVNLEEGADKDFTVTYNYWEPGVETSVTPTQPNVTSVKDAGTYQLLSVKGTSTEDAGSGYYGTIDYTDDNIEVIVKPRPITVTAMDQEIEVGGTFKTTPVIVGSENPNIETITTGVSGETAALQGELKITAKVNVPGEYADAITQGTVAFKDNSSFLAKNYNMDFKAGDAIVTKIIDGNDPEDVEDIVLEIEGAETDDNGKYIYNGVDYSQQEIAVKITLSDGTLQTINPDEYNGTISWGDADEVKNVGTYTASITFDSDIYGSATVTKTIEIIPRSLTVNLTEVPTTIPDDVDMDNLEEWWSPWDDVTYLNEVEPEFTYTRIILVDENGTEIERLADGDIVKVKLEGAALKDGKDGFLKDNYTPTWMYGETEVALEDDGSIILPPTDEDDGDDTGIEVVDPDEGGSIGGGSGIVTKRYQLFLANKDYTFLDVKTDYAAEGLELFSRHDRKYTDAGGSFTVWYEKDGVANEGGYRIFIKRGKSGDYQEVKFDPVSEYFQIRNVQSDIYVKIYAADGFPVGNEEIAATDFRAYAQPNKIIVITPEPTDVQIISMAGAVVAADKVTGQCEFANLAEGVYIVRMGETIVKLQVRN